MAANTRFPTIFLPHGGGPWPLMDGAFLDAHAKLAEHLRAVDAMLGRRPAAVVIISAHWEAPLPTVGIAARPPMLYDYGGFPDHTYRFSYPAPGSEAVANDVRAALTHAGIAHATDAARGFDHGVFVPMMLVYPQADVPIVTLSLRADMDASAHLALGRALAPLRERDVLIAGSGMTFHNRRALRNPGAKHGDAARQFDTWLANAIAAPPTERDRALLAWHTAPAARDAHPTAEHFMPLVVVAGAADQDAATRTFQGEVLGSAQAGYLFG